MTVKYETFYSKALKKWRTLPYKLKKTHFQKKNKEKIIFCLLISTILYYKKIVLKLDLLSIKNASNIYLTSDKYYS